MKRLIFLLLVLWSVLGLGQTHIFPALDTNNVFTGTNTFAGPTTFPGGIPLVLAGDGTVGNPSIGFLSSPSTGMWWDSGNTRITFSNQGVSVLDLAPTISTFRSGAIGFGVPRDTSITRTAAGVLTADTGTPGNALGVWNAAQYLAGDGSKTAVALGFSGVAGLGFYRFPASSDIVIAAASVNQTLIANNLWRQGSGVVFNWSTNADPTLATGDIGLKRAGTNLLTTVTDESGTVGGKFQTGVFLASDGTAGAPAYSWTNETGSGFRRTGVNAFTFTIGGSDRIAFGTANFQLQSSVALGFGFPSDAGISRLGVGITGAGNGTAGDTSGEFDARTFGITGSTSGKGTLTVDATATKLTSSVPLNATTGFQIGGAATTNQALIGNGTNFVSTALTLASAQFANQGTTTTLLHGNAAGNPSFSAVSLTADVTGTLPLGNVGSPTGTGYAHITAGAWDAASKLINLTAATDVAANQGTTTTLLHGNAAGQAVFGSVVSADLNITTTTCTNQFLTAISATGVGTCTTDTLASAQHANQGTTTTVLHGNGAGNPSFAVVTPSDAAGNTNGSGNFALTTSPVFVTPTLGVATATAVVSATASPAAAGVIRLANADTINFRNNAGSGDVTIAKTQATSGLVLADTLNVSSFAGMLMAGPIWGANSIAVDTTHPISIPAATDTMAVLALAQTFTNKRLTPRIVTMADAASVTPTSDTADENIFTSTQVAGTLTVNAPTGTPTDGQKLILRLKSTNAQTYSFNATYAFSTTTTAPTTLAAGKSDNIGLIWNATNTKWDVVAVDQGH